MAFAETPYGKFFYFQPDSIGQAVAGGQFWDAHLRPFIDALGEDSVMVDVGANIGFLTIYCALFRKARVHAFEASPDVFDLLKRNVEANGVSAQVQLYCMALYDKRTKLDLNPAWVDFARTPDGGIDYEQSPNSGGLSLVPNLEGRWSARPLDDFGLERVDLLKTDTQGSDLRILLGARRTIELSASLLSVLSLSTTGPARMPVAIRSKILKPF